MCLMFFFFLPRGNSAIVVASSLSTLAKLSEVVGTHLHLFFEVRAHHNRQTSNPHYYCTSNWCTTQGLVGVVMANMHKYMDDSERPMITEIGCPRPKQPPTRPKGSQAGEEDTAGPLNEKIEVGIMDFSK